MDTSLKRKQSIGDREPPRSIQEIFSDLTTIAQSDGALHEISAIVYRDWTLVVDTVENRVVDSHGLRWSNEKLNNNELLLLLGLMVQSSSDRTYSVQVAASAFIEKADKLLRDEFHDRLLVDMAPVDVPALRELITELKAADPMVASVVVDLYDFSNDALTDLSRTIVGLRHEVALTGKAIKALSIPTASGGLTYAVVKRADNEARGAAAAIGAKHKYDTKSDRWYVLLDSIQTRQVIDGLLPLVWAWRPDENEAKASEEVAKQFNSRWEARRAGAKR